MQRARKWLVVMLAIVSVIGIIPWNYSAKAEEVIPGFSIEKGSSNYSYSGQYRTTISVYKTLRKEKVVGYDPGPGMSLIPRVQILQENVLIGKTDCVMVIATSKKQYGGETYKTLFVKQTMNPKTSYSSIYNKNMYGVNRDTQVFFNYNTPYYEQDFAPQAMAPSGSKSISVSGGIELGYSDGLVAVGNISGGFSNNYDTPALRISATKNNNQRTIRYAFSSNSAQNASGFQKEVNLFCKSSYKALFTVTYSRAGSLTHTQQSNRILNKSSYWCQGESGYAEGQAAFSASMY